MSDPLAERCQLSARQAASAEPAFTNLLTYEFYDGPETGIAVTATGVPYRFEDVAESRYRRYRAYLLDRLTDAGPIELSLSRWLEPAEWELARQLPSRERYVGISDLWLGGLVVDRLQLDVPPPTDFTEAHQLLRSKFVSARLPA